MSYIGNWGGAKCSLTTDGVLTINTDSGSVIADDSSKAPWYNYSDSDKSKIIKVNILGHIKFNTNADLSKLFYNCKYLTSIDLSGFDTSNVTNMRTMFNSCERLVFLNIPNFNTLNVLNLQSMFYNCRLLTTIDLSNFDISSVTNIKSLFNSCKQLKYVNLGKFNTSKVSQAENLFYLCSNLQTIELSDSITFHDYLNVN